MYSSRQVVVIRIDFRFVRFLVTIYFNRNVPQNLGSIDRIQKKASFNEVAPSTQ